MNPSGDLAEAARASRARAYAPYSRYHVGAAVRAGDGRVFSGCNVENASYGLSMCAERTAIFSAIAAGSTVVGAVAVATEDGGTPCGACRQVLAEFAPRDGSSLVVLLLDAAGNVRETTLADLLPDAFALGGPRPPAPSPAAPGEGETEGKGSRAKPHPALSQAPPLPSAKRAHWERGQGGEGGNPGVEDSPS